MTDLRAQMANQGQIITIKSLPWKDKVVFNAAIKTFEDSYKSDWDAETVYGKMDPIATFKRTGRIIRVSLDVIAESKLEAIKNFNKVKKLTDFQYPSSKSLGTGAGRAIWMGPLFEVRFMNWVLEGRGSLLGFMDGFAFEPVIETGVFHEHNTPFMFPKQITVSFNLTVLHRQKRST